MPQGMKFTLVCLDCDALGERRSGTQTYMDRHRQRSGHTHIQSVLVPRKPRTGKTRSGAERKRRKRAREREQELAQQQDLEKKLKRLRRERVS